MRPGLLQHYLLAIVARMPSTSHVCMCEEPLDAAHERACREDTFRRLASTSALPPLPSGDRLTINMGSLADCDTGGRVWSSARVLCGWLCEQREDAIHGRSVLELGCGTGAVGLYAAAIGARRVVLSDGGSSALLQLAAANTRANCALWDDDGTQVTVIRHRWGEPAASGPEMRGHNLVLGSDVTYAVEALAPLCDSLGSQLETLSPGARAVLAHQHRSGTRGDEIATDNRLQNFTVAAKARGLRVLPIRTVSLDHGGRLVSLLLVSLRSVELEA